MHQHFEIRTASGVADIERARAIRHAVFCVEQGIPAELDDDGQDQHSVHVLACAASGVVGTARLTPGSDGHGVVSRVAVVVSERGRGLGAELVIALERHARARGLEWLTLSPHAHLESFYAELGYELLPGRETVGEHDLIKMRKRLGTLRSDSPRG